MLSDNIRNIEKQLRDISCRPNPMMLIVFESQALHIKNELNYIISETKQEFPSLSNRLKSNTQVLFSYSINGIIANPYVLGQIVEILNILNENITEGDANIWMNMHPIIIKTSKKLFLDGHYTNSAQDAFVEINDRLKNIYTIIEPNRDVPDGVDLMHKIFSLKNIKFCVSDLATESGRNIQQGMEFMLAGAVSALRNPRAHSNKIVLTKEEALRRLMFASMLMYMIDEAVEYSNIIED